MHCVSILDSSSSILFWFNKISIEKIFLKKNRSEINHIDRKVQINLEYLILRSLTADGTGNREFFFTAAFISGNVADCLLWRWKTRKDSLGSSISRVVIEIMLLTFLLWICILDHLSLFKIYVHILFLHFKWRVFRYLFMLNKQCNWTLMPRYNVYLVDLIDTHFFGKIFRFTISKLFIDLTLKSEQCLS